MQKNTLSLVMVSMLLMATFMTWATPVLGSCTNDLSQYKVCLPAVMGKEPPLPSVECCAVIKTANIACLCTTVGNAKIPDLNSEAALMLPKHCGVVAPGTPTCGSN